MPRHPPVRGGSSSPPVIFDATGQTTIVPLTIINAKAESGLVLKQAGADTALIFQNAAGARKGGLCHAVGNNAVIVGTVADDMILFANGAKKLHIGSDGGAAAWLVLDLTVGNGKGLIKGRNTVQEGAAVASAGVLTLGVDGNSFPITGTTTITNITVTNWGAGSEITLAFQAACQVTNNAGGAGNILLSGGANITFAANTILKLFFDGTNWIDVRKIA